MSEAGVQMFFSIGRILSATQGAETLLNVSGLFALLRDSDTTKGEAMKRSEINKDVLDAGFDDLIDNIVNENNRYTSALERHA